MPTMPGRAPDRLRRLPTWLLNQAAIPGNRLVAAALAGAGTRRHHFSLLTTLDELGPASQADLGRTALIDGSDMVASVNELAGPGFVERTPDPGDLRRNIITITAAGRRHLRKLDRLIDTAQDELLAPLSPAERTHLASLLTRIVDHHTAPS
jgi:MarR family transcriptional regulator, lower aerobic nicotinate degradation pathway regulator